MKRKIDFKFFEKILLKEREKILKQLGHSVNAISRPQTELSGDLSSYSSHMADQGSDTQQREIASQLLSSERKNLSEIEHALKKIEKKKYGLCEKCGKSIEKKRLVLIPYTRFCITCQKGTEHKK
ncbi:MAG: TraR/DksA C4-type zinc finger protein [candidate division WOR-3 bacterium]